MEVIVVDTETRGFARGTGRDAVIDVIDVGIAESEVVAVTDDSPSGVMASDMVHRHVIGLMPVDAIGGMCGSKVRSRGADIKILDGEVLHGAVVAPQAVNGHGVLAVGAAGPICGVLDNAVRAPIDRDVTAALKVNRAQT